MMGSGRYNRRWLRVGLPLLSAWLMSQPSRGLCYRMSRKNSKNTSLQVLKTIVLLLCYTEGKCKTKHADQCNHKNTVIVP